MTAGTIATSDPRASRIGGEALAEGGNALDAAVTAAFALLVLEPHACGLGGDAFVLMKRPDRPPFAIDGSGAIPHALATAANAPGFSGVPRTGPSTLTVPGAVDLFEYVLARYGTFSLDRATAPARELAREGFAVRRTLAAAVERMKGFLAEDAVLSALYLPERKPVQEGQWIRNERLAEAIDLIARRGAREMYKGALALAIAERSRSLGGYLGVDDLSAHRSVPMQPLSTSFRGAEVWELPRPTQGVAVLTALERLEASSAFEGDALVEAIIAGMLASGVDLRPARSTAAAGGDTTYVAVIDDHGLGVSLITSIFSEFGSTVGVEALGGALQNRANGVSALGELPRVGKPPHTTIPALVTQQGELAFTLGVVGGYMQAQGQVQVLVNLLVRGMSPQEAVDEPRFRVLAGGELAIEAGHELARRYPEAVGRDPGNGGFGGAQVVALESGERRGGTDPRRGGLVVDVAG